MRKINFPDELPPEQLGFIIAKLRKSGQTWEDIDIFKNTRIANTIDALHSIGYTLDIVEGVGIVGVKEVEEC